MNKLTLILSSMFLFVFFVFAGLGVYLAMNDDSYGSVVVPCWMMIYAMHDMAKDKRIRE